MAGPSAVAYVHTLIWRGLSAARSTTRSPGCKKSRASGAMDPFLHAHYTAVLRPSLAVIWVPIFDKPIQHSTTCKIRAAGICQSQHGRLKPVGVGNYSLTNPNKVYSMFSMVKYTLMMLPTIYQVVSTVSIIPRVPFIMLG